MTDLSGKAVSVATGIALALVIVAASILPFLTPQWVAFAQDRSDAAAWTGFPRDDLRIVTDALKTL